MTSLMDPTLYAALMTRRSVRRYRPEPLPDAVLDRIRALPDGIQPLIPENEFHVEVREDMRVDRTMLRAFGAYGAVVNPPHALFPLPYWRTSPPRGLGLPCTAVDDRDHRARDRIMLSWCGRPARPKVRRLLNLPDDAHLGAVLIFGQPLRSLTETPSDKKRLPFEEIYFQDSFEHPARPADKLLPVLQAARRAPSAVNTQPWRFLWQEPWLHLFVKRNNRSYLSHANQPYRHVDGGIVMANISLTLQALNMSAPWSFATTLPPYPPELEHLASIALRA